MAFFEKNGFLRVSNYLGTPTFAFCLYLRFVCYVYGFVFLGAVIIFTGLFSVAFLGSYLQGFRWLGMGFVTIGLVVVGMSDIIFDENPKDDINGIITGYTLEFEEFFNSSVGLEVFFGWKKG